MKKEAQLFKGRPPRAREADGAQRRDGKKQMDIVEGKRGVLREKRQGLRRHRGE